MRLAFSCHPLCALLNLFTFNSIMMSYSHSIFPLCFLNYFSFSANLLIQSMIWKWTTKCWFVSRNQEPLTFAPWGWRNFPKVFNGLPPLVWYHLTLDVLINGRINHELCAYHLQNKYNWKLCTRNKVKLMMTHLEVCWSVYQWTRKPIFTDI